MNSSPNSPLDILVSFRRERLTDGTETRKNNSTKTKYQAAYDGALFDSNGNCLVHSSIKLRTKKANGEWRMLRKNCPKCLKLNNHRGGGNGTISKRLTANFHGSVKAPSGTGKESLAQSRSPKTNTATKNRTRLIPLTTSRPRKAALEVTGHPQKGEPKKLSCINGRKEETCTIHCRQPSNYNRFSGVEGSLNSTFIGQHDDSGRCKNGHRRRSSAFDEQSRMVEVELNNLPPPPFNRPRKRISPSSKTRHASETPVIGSEHINVNPDKSNEKAKPETNNIKTSRRPRSSFTTLTGSATKTEQEKDETRKIKHLSKTKPNQQTDRSNRESRLEDDDEEEEVKKKVKKFSEKKVKSVQEESEEKIEKPARKDAIEKNAAPTKVVSSSIHLPLRTKGQVLPKLSPTELTPTRNKPRLSLTSLDNNANSVFPIAASPFDKIIFARPRPRKASVWPDDFSSSTFSTSDNKRTTVKPNERFTKAKALASSDFPRSVPPTSRPSNKSTYDGLNGNDGAIKRNDSNGNKSVTSRNTSACRTVSTDGFTDASDSPVSSKTRRMKGSTKERLPSKDDIEDQSVYSSVIYGH